MWHSIAWHSLTFLIQLIQTCSLSHPSSSVSDRFCHILAQRPGLAPAVWFLSQGMIPPPCTPVHIKLKQSGYWQIFFTPMTNDTGNAVSSGQRLWLPHEGDDILKGSQVCIGEQWKCSFVEQESYGKYFPSGVLSTASVNAVWPAFKSGDAELVFLTCLVGRNS